MVRARELSRALERAGFARKRQSGSHMFFVRTSDGRTTVIPSHSSDLKPGTLRTILRQTGLSSEDLRRLLGKR